MSSPRQRSSSFHEEPGRPPLPDLAILHAAPEGSTTDTTPEEEPDFDTLVRTRSRSRSLHDSEEEISNKIVANANLNPHPTPPSQKEGGNRPDPIELVGPIHTREAMALKKGLEEATEKKDAKAEREEQAELEAAARERAKRASAAQVGQSGQDPICRKVKVLVLGDSGVGKSSIIQRWISDSFSPSLVSTLGVDLKTKRMHIDDKYVQVQVWDTAGQTAFHKITTSYYRGSNAILLVYDVSDRNTLTNIEYWMKNIKERASENVQVALIGNKMDLRTTPGYDCVRHEEGQKAADKYKVLYVETSAMTSGHEVEVAFEKIVHKVLALDNNNSSHILKLRLTSGDTNGTRSPENVSLFSKKDSGKKEHKNILGKLTESEPKNQTPVAAGTSPDSDAKKKDCVIS